MNRYFGPAWDAPFIEDAQQVPTPVGELCLECQEPIAEGEQGVVMPLIYEADGAPAMRYAPEHRGCMLLGVVGHIAGTCFCHGGLGTVRERGLLTVEWAERNR